MLNVRPSSFLVAGIVFWIAAACVSTPAPTTPLATATPSLPDCAAQAPVATPIASSTLLPAFAPDCACELENASVRVDECLVHASPELTYPCSRSEEVHEVVLGSAGSVRLIQRDHAFTAGCWHSTTTEERSLRLCDADACYSRVVAERVRGDPVAAPSGARWAYVAAGPELDGLAVNVFVIDLADGTPVRLDPQPMPQASVVGAQILGWSDDEHWLEVSLWDGAADGYHRYRLSTDGRGDFETLP